MSTPLEQVALAVVTAGCVSFASITYYAGASDQQIKINTDQIEKNTATIADVPVMKSNIRAMERRLDTYESLVINGQKKILEQISAIRIDSAKQSTKIGAIEVDIKEINAKINN